MKILARLLWLVPLLAAPSGWVAQTPPPDTVRIALQGWPLSPESARGPWWGVYSIGTGSVLRQAQVEVSAEGGETRIYDQGDVAPELLLTGLPSLRPGNLATGRVDGTYLDGTDSIRVSFADSTYALLTEDHPEGQPGVDVQIFLTDGRTTQIVDDRVEIGVHYPSLPWAGDLDGDGGLDFLLASNGGHYCNPTWSLFLSSRAEAGDLVAKVAEIEAICM